MADQVPAHPAPPPIRDATGGDIKKEPVVATPTGSDGFKPATPKPHSTPLGPDVTEHPDSANDLGHTHTLDTTFVVAEAHTLETEPGAGPGPQSGGVVALDGLHLLQSVNSAQADKARADDASRAVDTDPVRNDHGSVDSTEPHLASDPDEGGEVWNDPDGADGIAALDTARPSPAPPGVPVPYPNTGSADPEEGGEIARPPRVDTLTTDNLASNEPGDTSGVTDFGTGAMATRAAARTADDRGLAEDPDAAGEIYEDAGGEVAMIVEAFVPDEPLEPLVVEADGGYEAVQADQDLTDFELASNFSDATHPLPADEG